MRLLSKDQILEALDLLSIELGREAGTGNHNIVIAGGAALVLLYNARDSTRDIDAVVSDETIKAAARRVSAALELPDDWLNDGAKGYLQGLAVGDIVFETESLIVRALAPRQLLAMKLSAWRDDVDIEDARLLLSKLVGGREEVWEQVEPFLVVGRELKARYAFEDLWENHYGPS